MTTAPFVATWTVRTEVFDGPLDLLLYLVRKDGVELRHVSMARIADAYLAYLDRMRELHLGVAADYLVMAATLCHLKSLELLPRPPTPRTESGEPEEDPREALVRRLVDYERFKHAAEALDDRPIVGRDVFVRDPDTSVDDRPRPWVPGIDAFGLLDLYHALLLRQDRGEAVYEIGGSGPDIDGCFRHVLRALGGPGGRADLRVILAPLRTVVERIVGFLAVLEMTRLRWLEIEQSEHLGPVTVTSRVPADTDISAALGQVEVAPA